MVRTTTYNYEVSSESGRERHIKVPYARMEDATPTLHDPAALLSVIPGTQEVGTLIEVFPAPVSEAVINVARGAVYWHNVRNVLTYNVGGGGIEATWGALNVGDPVFYDRSAVMPATTKLSKSPLDNTGAINPLFGYVVLGRQENALSYPKGAGGVASTQEAAIIQA
jgi:hypothetical protein